MLKAPLKEYFGFDEFREGQKEIIESILAGQQTFGVLPTGTGKSLCYQLPGYLLAGSIVIISPLISLMEDQVASLQQKGEKRAIALNSLLDQKEKNFVLDHLSEYKFIYLSPEMLATKEVLAKFKQIKIALFVVDEAHCISQWGVDFRPEYLQLGQLIKELKKPLTLALTATATLAVKKEIKELLFSNKVAEFSYSVDRKNIALFVKKTADKFTELQDLLNLQGSGIIYCATRKNVEKLYEELNASVNCGYYHGGLSAAERRVLQQQFIKGQLQVLIATNAFGMGIDKPDIRFVIHYDLPANLENYLQEIGRAGRDGNLSQAILLYQPEDEKIHYYFQKKQKAIQEQYRMLLERNELAAIKSDRLFNSWWQLRNEKIAERFSKQAINRKKQLQQMLFYIHETNCRRAFILKHFGEEKSGHDQNCCDNDGAKLLLEQGNDSEKMAVTNESWQTILLNLFKK